MLPFNWPSYLRPREPKQTLTALAGSWDENKHPVKQVTDEALGFRASEVIHSRKLTWKPKKGPVKTTVPLKGGYMGFHVSLGECTTSSSPIGPVR